MGLEERDYYREHFRGKSGRKGKKKKGNATWQVSRRQKPRASDVSWTTNDWHRKPQEDASLPPPGQPSVSHRWTPRKVATGKGSAGLPWPLVVWTVGVATVIALGGLVAVMA